MSTIRFLVGMAALAAVSIVGPAHAQTQPEVPKPDVRSGNWLYKTPDAAIWKKTEKDGAVRFDLDLPPGDFCTLTLFPGDAAAADFQKQFAEAVDADQKEKGTISVEADSGPQASKAQDGFDVLTRSLRSETAALHTFHMYVGTHSGDRFDLAAFQTTSEEIWNQHAAEATAFLSTLKLANSLDPAEVERLVRKAAAGGGPKPPPTLPGLGGAAPSKAPPAAAAPTPVQAEGAAQAKSDVPMVLPENSDIVVKDAAGVPVVGQKNGKGIDGVKLSQHDTDIGSPSIAVAPDGVIHVAFVEQHRTTYAYAVYHRSSADGGKTWTEAKNLSEDMPGVGVGRCQVIADAGGRVYAIWRAGLAVNFTADMTPYSGGRQCNLWYRVLEGGKWTKAALIHPPADVERQSDGSLSSFATVDAAGRAQVVWNSTPDKWHPELMHVSGEYRTHLSGVGNGLVFQATLDGASVTAPREVFMPVTGGLDDPNHYSAYCDGLDTINGYVDAAGVPHFIAAVTSTHDPVRGKARYEVIEDGRVGQVIDLPELSFHAWSDVPTLLVDARGQRHVIALYLAGEHPNVRDYLVGSDDEPIVIRAAVGLSGTADGFQAYQGPGGRMAVIMQMNDSGEQASGESYVSISTGGGMWSTPLNITNNTGRKTFASTQTSPRSNVAVETSAYPGPAAAAFDREGHLLVVMINKEFSLFGSTAFGVELAGGSSSTPTLRFLRF